MENKGFTLVDGVEVDISIAEKIMRRLIICEKNNIKTKRYNDSEMVKEIRKMIEEEVQC